MIDPALADAVTQLVSLGVLGLVGFGANLLKKKTGMEIEQKYRDSLHMALTTGILAALQRGLSGHAAIEAAVGYARMSVPGAIQKLGPTEQVLANLATAKLQQAMEGR
jgi:hypothetical protein